MHTSTVSAKGWVVIPKSIREKHGLKKGSRVQVLDYGQILAIVPLPDDPIEALHGMFEEMTGDIPEQNKFNLYIETLSQIKNRDGRFIRWADIRLLRRMVRDMQFRNYSPKQTIAHWHYVRRSEMRYIISRISKAHFIFNSFLPYELPIMKYRLGEFFPGFVDEFKDDPEKADALARAQRVIEMFDEFPEWSDERVVPGTSLLREFIGGSRYSY